MAVLGELAAAGRSAERRERGRDGAVGLSPAGPAAAVIAAQHAAGNAAVSRMIAAGAPPAPGRRLLLRDPRLVQGSDPPRYRDRLIPRATLRFHGWRLLDGFGLFEVLETGQMFFYDADTGTYYLDGESVDPRTLSQPEPVAISSASTPGFPGGGGGRASSATSSVTGPTLLDVHMDEEEAPAPRRRKREREMDQDEEREEVEARPAKRARRITWVSLDVFKRELDRRYGRIVHAAIVTVFTQIRLHPYTTAGAQSATTTAEGRSFKTTLNKHSEMCALDEMLSAGIYRLVGGHVQPPAGGFQFSTPAVPHCGHCTFFLQLLGLPLSTPSMGNYNFAVNRNYPLPQVVFESEDVLNALLALGGAGANAMTAVINFAAGGQGVAASWREFIDHGYLRLVWWLVFDRLYKYFGGSA